MKRLLGTVALAILLLSMSAENVSAMGRLGRRCGGCDVCCAPAPCAPQYVTVQRTVYKMKPVVTEQEIVQNVCVPKVSVVERERTIYIPVHKEEIQKRICYKTECVEQLQDRTSYFPVMKTVDREVIVRVPEYKQEPRKQLVTTYKHVQETVVRKVCTYECVAVQKVYTDPCNPCNTYVRCCYQRVPVYKDVPTVITRCIPETKEVNVMVNVCTYHIEKKIVPTQVCSYETKVEKVKVLVPVTKPVEETVKVLVCKYETKVEKYKVEVCTYEMKQEKKKVQVTTYECVPEVINVQVPAGCY
jgi:hypothetical protein